MKKTIFITVIALGLAIGNVNASDYSETTNNYTETKVSKINDFCIAIAKGDMETFQKMISSGEDINKKSNGMTPAMYAAKYNRVEILKILIAYGADLNIRSIRGIKADKYAKKANAVEALKLLEDNMK